MLEFYDTCWLIRSILSGVRSLGLGQSWFYYLCTGHPWVSYLVPQFSSIVLCLVRINQGNPNKSLGHLFMVKMLLIYLLSLLLFIIYLFKAKHYVRHQEYHYQQERNSLL